MKQRVVDFFKNIKKGTLRFILIYIGIILLLSLSTFTYLVAYEKVTLKNTGFQTGVANFIMSIPVLPKTPRYILTKAIASQKDLKSYSFDLSLAISTTSNALVPGVPFLNNFDVHSKGDVDFTNLENIAFNITTELTKDIDFDLLLKDKKVFFKVDKVEGEVLALIRTLGQVNLDFMQKWFFFDTTPLQTQARKNLADMQVNQPKNLTDDVLKILSDEQIFTQLKLESDKTSGNKTHKITLVVKPELVDRLAEIINPEVNLALDRPSEVIKDTVLTVWIDPKTYNLVRSDSVFTFSSDALLRSYALPSEATPLSGNNTSTNFSMSTSFSNFNDKFDIKEPENALEISELIKFLQPGR